MATINLLISFWLTLNKPLSAQFVFMESGYKKVSVIICLWVAISIHPGCSKEYSYERGPAADTTQPLPEPEPDTVIQPVVGFPACAFCDVSIPVGDEKWQFKNEGAFVCGNVTRAVIAPDRTAFTFWGTSACSPDSGLIITVIMASALDKDKTDLYAQQVSVLYYDNITPSDVFKAPSTGTFGLHIDQYTHADAFASGTFSGPAFTMDGRRTMIEEGRFRIFFR